MARQAHPTRKPRTRLQDSTPSELLDEFVNDLIENPKRSRNRPFDPLIVRSDGLAYPVSSKAIQLAKRLAIAERASSKEDVARFSVGTYERLSMVALGDTIADLKRQAAAATDLSANIETGDILKYFRSSLRHHLAGATTDLFRHIPCHIFHATSHTSEFTIGTVHFMVRSPWADRYISDERVRHEVMRAWGEPFDALALTDQEQTQVEHVLNTVGVHEWVAVVFVREHDLDSSHSTANVLVGLGLDALGVPLGAQDAALLNRAGVPFSSGGPRLATTGAGHIFGGSSARLPGIGGHPDMADEFLAQTESYRGAAGEILSSYAEARGKGADAPWLIERWVNALHWFGEARRETSDFMAVVKYGCALDILTGAGGEIAAMARYVELALGITEATDQAGRPVSISDLINNLFNEGRSALVHGEAFGLLADRVIERARADIVVQQILLAVTEPLGLVVKQNDRMLGVDKVSQLKAFRARLAGIGEQRRRASEREQGTVH